MDTFWNFLAGLLKFLISFIIIGPLIAILLIGIGIGTLFAYFSYPIIGSINKIQDLGGTNYETKKLTNYLTDLGQQEDT